MKAYGGVGVLLHHFLTSAGWALELPVWKLWSREKSLATAKNRASAVQPVARRYTD
jgi:hypothetical protein